MHASTQSPPAPTMEQARTPYEFILAWSLENIGRDDEPGVAAVTLHDVEQALHAIDEFLFDPIAKALKKVAADAYDAEHEGPYPIPEDERLVSYEEIGRLIAFTDTVREAGDDLHATVSEITLLAHEDLQAIAAGYCSAGVVHDEESKAELRRFHGLDRGRFDA